ncbi:2Fe-2S iron-sulfur cluster-binding protein [Solimicrobium silvestre]|uniref:2Fe-2S iron-sulfur cluster binding domain n=1 Tax=Solimicrobium silvestre TaxID=2099400 RepID=A0A2S9GXU0_9BURK|nr:2Fe-2S iron-sulfur cluster-binding protein [Solimicrobium silvestre]PRC92476.1 2Fe-2S iron-sulfur cluster binding domain [Solimicrobium silvestre]
MPHDATITVDGRVILADTQMSVASAIALTDRLLTRRSVTGEARFAVCGMGVCQECRVTINGVPHRLACQTRCLPDMVILTGREEQR